MNAIRIPRSIPPMPIDEPRINPGPSRPGIAVVGDVDVVDVVVVSEVVVVVV